MIQEESRNCSHVYMLHEPSEQEFLLLVSFWSSEAEIVPETSLASTLVSSSASFSKRC